jgi:hypothetical protein
MTSLFGPFFQVSYVAPDMDAALAHWTKTLGVGPFFVFPKISFGELTVRGKPSKSEIQLAMAFSGDMHIELVRPLNDEPSIFHEFLKAGGKGAHHVAAMTPDFTGAMQKAQAAGHKVAQGGRLGDTQFAYFDTEGAFPGTIVELLEASTSMTKLFAKLKKAAAEWDGSEPVRRL